LIKKNGLKKRTANTITDTDKLRHHLNVIRQKGFAVDDEENEKGIRCVGAPVFNQQGQVIAAISISGPTVRITKKIIQQTLKNEVIRTAADISREFGFQG
jgi:IclR family acetate operon transcriptional repressor